MVTWAPLSGCPPSPVTVPLTWAHRLAGDVLGGGWCGEHHRTPTGVQVSASPAASCAAALARRFGVQLDA
jgi:hypothetical protein